MVSVFRAKPVIRLKPKPVTPRPTQPSPSSDAPRTMPHNYEPYRHDPRLELAIYELTHSVDLPPFSERQQLESCG